MDPETSRKISELAANLKKLHLAATMEEATQRAKEMILGIAGADKPIKELMKAGHKIDMAKEDITGMHEELAKKTEKLERESETAFEKVERLSDDFGKVKGQAKADRRVHGLRESDAADLSKDIKEIEQRTGEVKDIVKEAEYVKKRAEEEE